MNNLLHFAILFYSIFYFCFAKYLTYEPCSSFISKGLNHGCYVERWAVGGAHPLVLFFLPVEHPSYEWSCCPYLHF